MWTPVHLGPGQVGHCLGSRLQRASYFEVPSWRICKTFWAWDWPGLQDKWGWPDASVKSCLWGSLWACGHTASRSVADCYVIVCFFLISHEIWSPEGYCHADFGWLSLRLYSGWFLASELLMVHFWLEPGMWPSVSSLAYLPCILTIVPPPVYSRWLHQGWA